MNLFSTARLLCNFWLRPIRGATHAERLESFYGFQANEYDAFRERFLIGRRELVERLEFPAGGCWIDLGCGTGYLLDQAGARARACEAIYLVDLTPSLAAKARERIQAGGWTNVTVVEAEAASFDAGCLVDVVTFSYALSMMGDWFAALDRAIAQLKPGGLVGVADFYVSAKHPPVGRMRHSWLTRAFWPAWFDIDGVRPNADFLSYLHHHLDVVWLHETRTRVPSMPFFRPPCFQLIGRKRS